MGGSAANVDWVKKRLFVQTIGPDKLNMLRHVLFFKDMQGIADHMDKHAKILSPKFQMVLRILQNELGGKGIASWTNPEGGYFICLDTSGGCATKVVDLAAQLGVKFTQAGATYPYKNDPKDCNIRIAPSFPSLTDIEKAIDVLCVCVQYAALE